MDRQAPAAGMEAWLFAMLCLRLESFTMIHHLMIHRLPALLACLLLLGFAASWPSEAGAQELVKLASTPALSSNGMLLVFSWSSDLWVTSSEGGSARRLTTHHGLDAEPKFSPDDSLLAFTSDRDGGRQVYTMDAGGSAPVKITSHTEGYSLQGWYADGKSLLTRGNRDHFWRHPERFLRVQLKEGLADELLFDAYGSDGTLSPDGRRLLFTREGTQWWRKGYVGAQASQVWMYDLKKKRFTKLADHPSGCRWPLWHPDGKRFYYVGGQSGSFNLWLREVKSGKEEQVTHFEDDAVVNPCISGDGSTIVFRQLFDLYRLQPGKDAQPQKLDIYADTDTAGDSIIRRNLDKAASVTFTKDGLEMAFIAGGDVWVMDTQLREPRQVTSTPAFESNAQFSPDGKTLVYVSAAGGQVDVWQATRADEKSYWWQNNEFPLRKLTDDAEEEDDLQFTPDGKHLAYLRSRGDLWMMGSDGKNPRRVIESWNGIDYDFSPDSKWVVYAKSDNDFNRDVWLSPLDGSREPFNLSRHPDNDDDPVWSPDGKMIAFTGRRMDTEVDVYFVYVEKASHEEGSRERKLAKAIEKIQKVRKEEQKSTSGKSSATPEVEIDFDGIHDRIRRVLISDSTESNLFWSHDSKKLAFSSSGGGKSGTYTISPPDDLSPKRLSTQTGSHARWISQGNQIVWLSGGVPGSVSATGTATQWRFSCRQEIDSGDRFQAAFVEAWRVMRDYWYDPAMNNRNWDAVRRKYAEMAHNCVDEDMLTRVVSLMLGELNGSHLGFYASRPAQSSPTVQWNETTAHLGVRFDPSYKGPGLKAKDVLHRGPADREGSKIEPGELILGIDGTTVDPGMNLAPLLNGLLNRDIQLRVRNAAGEDREVVIRPISYAAARTLLYDTWRRHNQQMVEKASGGKLGYLHIRSMNMSSFYRFESDLYDVAAGKDGLVIDVRENGGGFTTDHLLTALTQPEHAVTVPRGGGEGYPHDRRVYATWSKPIVVLCNQNSFSNAEIFSHAVKSLGRGQLIGVPTAGAVISTGQTSIMDVGRLRVPFRGWFVLGTGDDMELNGAVPHHILWPLPGQLPAGKDVQLEKAIGVLKGEVRQWTKSPAPKPHYASRRDLDESQETPVAAPD